MVYKKCSKCKEVLDGTDCWCKKCKLEYNKRYRRENKERAKEYRKKWHKNNPRYYQQNRETLIQRAAVWNKLNKEKRNKRRLQRRREDLKYRIDNVMRSNIYEALKCKKNGRHWEDLVGYTLNDLIEHLEKNFEPWMSWENYGKYEESKKKWHIDHIKPMSLFKYEKPRDEDFKDCWSLGNLQPLGAVENMRKYNSYV